jgi:hypothetical protein
VTAFGWIVDRRRPRLLTSALVVVAAICAIGLVRFMFQPLPLWDLRVHLEGALAWLHGRDPYVIAIEHPSAGSDPGSGYVYPPYTIPLFVFLLGLGPFTLVVWQLAQLGAMAWLIWSLALPRSPRRLAILTIVVVGFYPTITNVVLGQAGLLMVAALWTAVGLVEQRRATMAAMVIVLGGLLKVFPLLLLIGIAWKRWWLAGAAAIATLLAIVVGTMPWVGGLWPEYLASVLLAKASSPTSYGDAQSIVSAAVRSFPQHPAAAHLAGLLLAGATLVGVLAIAALADRRNSRLGWAVLLAALPLTMPYAWQHYYVLALPLLWLVASSGYATRDPWLIASAIFAYACLSLLAFTIDYWFSPIAGALGNAQWLYTNSSVLGDIVLLLAGMRLAFGLPSSRQPARGQPQRKAA